MNQFSLLELILMCSLGVLCIVVARATIKLTRM